LVLATALDRRDRAVLDLAVTRTRGSIRRGAEGIDALPPPEPPQLVAGSASPCLRSGLLRPAREAARRWMTSLT